MWEKLLTFILILCIILIGAGIESETAEAEPSQQLLPEMGPFIQIWDDAGSNSNPVVAYNPHRDEYLVVWVTAQDQFSSDIWGRRLRGDGSLIPNSWFNIDNFAGIHLVNPAIAYNSQTDQYLVVYTAELSTDDHDIWGKLVNWNGGLSSRLYIDSRLQEQNHPAVAYNKHENQYLVAYSDWQSSSTVNVYLQTLNPVGGGVKATAIVSATGEYRGGPDLAYNVLDNRYLVVYGYESSFLPRILGKSFSATLVSLSPEFHYNDDGDLGTNPKIACHVESCLVAWNGFGDSKKIKARRISRDGTSLGPNGGFEIAAPIQNVIQSTSRVSLFKPWGYLITWNHFLTTTADMGDVYGVVVGFGKDQTMGNSFPIDDRSHYEGSSDLACDPSGSCLAVNSHNPVQYPAGDMEISGRLVFTLRNFIPLSMR
jgi:hypothetical protein